MPDEKPLTILHTESSGGWGGQEIRILTESAGMIGRGYNVKIICQRKTKIYSEAIKMNIPVVALPIGHKKISSLLILHKWLKKNPADIINTHSSTDSWLTALAILFLKKRPKVIRTRHVSAPVSKNLPTTWLYTKASDYIVTTGEKIRRTLIENNGFSPKKITSIPTGIDENYFTPGEKLTARKKLSLPEKRFIIGIVATIRSWKGHIYLIQAVAKLKDPNIHLLIVGDGPSRHLIEAELIKTNLTKQTTMAGNQADVVPWLQSMDLFVLPSYANEGVPQSLIQAMLCNIPVISTPVGSIEELVINDKTGVLVPPKDAENLKKSIAEVMHSDVYRDQSAQSGREHALKHYTKSKMLDDMESVFIKSLI